MIEIPIKVQYILNTFKLNGYDAYIVGGCVRDSLIGTSPNDWDITTNCKPEKIQDLFNKTLPTGIKHGTVTVILDNESFEITTFRTEGIYINNRTPSKVNFVSDIKDDLSRRDFTINAMAFNYDSGLVDYFNGINDIKNCTIKTVGNSDLRFKEDALRMIRAIRFSTTLDFSIGNETFESIVKNGFLISNISVERIREEFFKILLSSNSSKGIILLYESKLLKHIIPELYYVYKNDSIKLNYISSLLKNCPNKLNLKIALLLNSLYDCHNNDVNVAIDIMRKLKFDNHTLNSVSMLIKESSTFVHNKTKFNIKKFILKIGIQNLNDLFLFQNVLLSNDLNSKENLSITKTMADEIIKNNEPLSIKDLSINGNDLISIGFPKDNRIRLTLNELLNLVLENPSLNNKSILIELSKDMLTKYKCS